jgi:hypothetical protein
MVSNAKARAKRGHGQNGQKRAVLFLQKEGCPLSFISKATMFHALAGGMQKHGMGSRLARKARQTKRRQKNGNSMIGKRVLRDKRWMHVGSRKDQQTRLWEKQEKRNKGGSTVHWQERHWYAEKSSQVLRSSQSRPYATKQK